MLHLAVVLIFHHNGNFQRFECSKNFVANDKIWRFDFESFGFDDKLQIWWHKLAFDDDLKKLCDVAIWNAISNIQLFGLDVAILLSYNTTRSLRHVCNYTF